MARRSVNGTPLISRHSFLGPYWPRRNAGHDALCRHVVSNHSAGSDDRTFADGDPGHDHSRCSDGCTTTHENRLESPVSFSLQTPILVRSRWITIIEKVDVMPDKHFVLDS